MHGVYNPISNWPPLVPRRKPTGQAEDNNLGKESGIRRPMEHDQSGVSGDETIACTTRSVSEVGRDYLTNKGTESMQNLLTK